jgi:hypothetical protein
VQLAAQLSSAQAPAPKAPPGEPAAVQPRVVLSAAHAKACKATVGDAAPDAMVQDAAGQAAALKGLRGPKLTLLIFWNSDNQVSSEEVRRLPKRLGTAVKIVAIHSGKPAATGPPAAAGAGQIAHYSDATGAALGAFCTDGKVPRTYLLDAAGKIVWFDIEYSIDTERQLHNAIRFYSK